MASRRSVKTIEAKLLVDLTQFKKGFDEAAKTLDRRGSQLVSAGTRISAAITAPLVAAGGVAVKLAADAEVSQRRFQKVFGESAKEVKSFANTLGQATGNSSFALQALLANTQDIITGLGATTEEGAELSKQLTVLGTDLAAFTGTEAEEAILALTRALTGETEGLKSLGLAIKAADIDMKLLEQGIDGGAKAATAAEKAVAILAVAQDQSANAAGAAANNADTLNAMWDATKSRAVDLATEIGLKMIPAVKEVFSIVENSVGAFSDLNDEQQGTVIKAGLVAAAIGPVTLAFGGALKAVSKLVSGIGTIAGAAINLAPLIGGVGIVAAGIAGATAGIILFKSTLEELGASFETGIGKDFDKLDKRFRDFTAGFRNFFGDAEKLAALSPTPKGGTPGLERLAGISDRAVEELSFTERVLKRSEEDTQRLIDVAREQGTAVFEGLKNNMGLDDLLGLVDEFNARLERRMLESAERIRRQQLEQARNRAFVFGGEAPSFDQLGQVPGLQVPNLGVTAPSLPEGAPDSKLPEKIEEAGRKAEEAEGFVGKLQDRFKRYTDAAQIGSDLVTNSIVQTSDAITDAIFAAESLADSFKAIAASILKEITRMIIQMTIFNAVSGALGGGSSFVSGLVGGASSTGKMSGGPIPAGSFARVGEAGPELISGPANVTPSSKLNQLARQQQPVIVQVINSSSNSTTRQEEENVNGQRVIRTIIEDIITRDVSRNGNISRSLTSNLTARRRAS